MDIAFTSSTMENLTNSSETTTTLSDEDSLLSPHLSYTLGSLMILTTIVTILGNLLVIIIIFRSPKIQTITSGFLMNLAIADLSTGILLLPFATSVQLKLAWVYSDEWCGILGFLYLVIGIVSTWTLASLSTERYIAVNHPLKYHQMLTKTRVWMAILLNWGCAIFMASIPFMANSNYVYLPSYGFCLPNLGTNGEASIVILMMGICLPFVIMCFAYISIGRVACTQARRKVIECNEDHCVYVSPKNKDYRAAKILAGLAGVFAFCWLPFTFLCCWDIWGARSVPALVNAVALWFTLLSSAINPWLYSILNRTFRAAMRILATQAAHKLPLVRNHFRVGPTTGNTQCLAGAGGGSMEMTECQDTQGRHTRPSTSNKRPEGHSDPTSTSPPEEKGLQEERTYKNVPSSEHITAVTATIEAADNV